MWNFPVGSHFFLSCVHFNDVSDSEKHEIRLIRLKFQTEKKEGNNFGLSVRLGQLEGLKVTHKALKKELYSMHFIQNVHIKGKVTFRPFNLSFLYVSARKWTNFIHTFHIVTVHTFPWHAQIRLCIRCDLQRWSEFMIDFMLSIECWHTFLLSLSPFFTRLDWASRQEMKDAPGRKNTVKQKAFVTSSLATQIISTNVLWVTHILVCATFLCGIVYVCYV